MFGWNLTKESGERKGEAGTRSLLRSVRPGSAPAEWVSAAIQSLIGELGVERAGVWLEDTSQNGEGSAAVFLGEVWEQETGTGPPEWGRLSANAPLPVELLSGGASFECGVDEAQPCPFLGPLADLSRALWVPVMRRGVLRGLILLGARRKNRRLPRGHAENVAAELGALLELEEEHRLATVRKADLELNSRVRSLLKQKQSSGMILAQLGESCTRGVANGGVGAVFALLGEIRRPDNTGPSEPSAAEELSIRAQSGETEWTYQVNSEPWHTLWQRVLEKGQVCSSEANGFAVAKEAKRIVGFPLRGGEGTRGVLLAGLTNAKSNLESLERLELRAQFAGEVLGQESRDRRDRYLQQSQRALLESTEDALVLVDERVSVVGASRGARELLGTLPAERTEENEIRFAELFRPRDWERMENWLKHDGTACESQLSSTQPVRVVRVPTGVGHFYAVRLEKPLGSAGIQKLVQSGEFLPQLLEGLEDGVAVFDHDGKVLASNGNFMRILGIDSTVRELDLPTLEEIIDASAPNASDPGAFRKAWRLAAEPESVELRQELEMRRPEQKKVERSVSWIRDSRGNGLARLEVYRVARGQREFESNMMRAEKLASLGQRITGIMHDLGNPLTTILGHAQRLLARENGDSPCTEIRQIREQAERASNILRQLLLLSRETKPERCLLSLNELVERTIDLHRSSLNGAALRIRVDVSERLPMVEGDYGQLQQVLINLLQNAQHAIELSGIGETLGVRTSGEAGPLVRLEVWDNGPGIPPHLRERIFDPFFTTKPPGIGTGLGLAIVSAIVRQHGGNIAVDCPAEGGARFVVDLPAAGEDSQTRPKRVLPFRSVGGAPLPVAKDLSIAGNGRPQRILVVEDEPTVANLIADVLRDEGMLVDVLADGSAAFEAAQRRVYDLTICDLKMPGMDGPTLYAKLLESQNLARERFLCVTGDVVANRTHEFLQKYGLPHLAKPFRVEELTVAVREMLDGNRHAAVP